MNRTSRTGIQPIERSSLAMPSPVVQPLPITREPVLLFGADPAEIRWLREVLESRFILTVCGRAVEALDVLRQHPRQPIVLGSRLPDTTPARFIAEARAQVMAALGEDALVLTVVDPRHEPSTPDLDAVYYQLRVDLDADDVRALFDGAATELRSRARPRVEAIQGPDQAASLQQVLHLSRRLALQDDPAEAASVAEEAVVELTDALRARCLFYDAESGELWREGSIELADGGRATAGLAGFAARTLRTVVVERADRDPRWSRAIDDPQGSGDERLMVIPLTEPRGHVHGVLIAVRRQRQPAFGAREVELVQSLVEQWGPLLGQLSLQEEAQGVLDRTNAEREPQVFGAEAMRLHAQGQRTGEILRSSSGWVTSSYWLVVALVIVGLAYLGLGRVHDYSVGHAVIRTDGQRELTAMAPGKVVDLAVEPGQTVQAGQVLARLHDATEEAELQQLDVEWRAHLRQYLSSPGDRNTHEPLAVLRARRDRARSRLEERTLRAPEDGRIGDLHVREGQHVEAGDLVATLQREGSSRYLLALLPGSDRPQLHPGMSLRFELTGYLYAYQHLEIESVSEEVIGPAEARRYLGPQSADSVPLDSPVVLVRAALPSESFRVGDDVYRYHDGMSGRAEARLRSQPILITLMPWLESSRD